MVQPAAHQTAAEAAAAAMRSAVFGPVQQLTKADQTVDTPMQPQPPLPSPPPPSPGPPTGKHTGNEELSDFIEAAGLLEYDPAAISRIYAGAPQRLIKRLWQTLVPIGVYLLSVAFDWLQTMMFGRDLSQW